MWWRQAWRLLWASSRSLSVVVICWVVAGALMPALVVGALGVVVGQLPGAIRDGMTQKDGLLPVNPSGGLKAKGHPIGATGVSMHVLSAMQLVGQAPEGMQIKNAKLAGIFNMGGAAVANYVSLLEPAK